MTHHTDILTTIVAHKRREIEMQQEAVSFSHLEHLISTYHAPPRRSLRQALLESSTGIIAEFKRKSPSKGWISRHAEAETVATGYTRAGAAALSVLTDEFFFGGNLSDIKAIRPHTDLPILRKDFILSEYQLYQARAIQADAVLLIAAVLSRKECRQLTRKAHELGLEVLLEIHSEHELEYLEEEVDLAGINNRHLGSFTTDVEHFPTRSAVAVRPSPNLRKRHLKSRNRTGTEGVRLFGFPDRRNLHENRGSGRNAK